MSLADYTFLPLISFSNYPEALSGLWSFCRARSLGSFGSKYAAQEIAERIAAAKARNQS